MKKNGVVLSTVRNNLTESIAYVLERDRVDFQVFVNVSKIKTKSKPNWVIFVNNAEVQPVLDYASKNEVKLLVITSKKLDLIKCRTLKNTIVTNLVDDIELYSATQKEFLFRKGNYSIVNNFISKFTDDTDLLVDGLITDLTEIEINVHQWTFEFSSLNESYSWLAKRNRLQDPKFELKIINFFIDRVYNDADKEIRYLIERISDIKNGQKSIDIFVCTLEELTIYKKNLFFLNLIKNISRNYQIYLVDKNKLKEAYSQILEKITYGVIIYDDCVYRDYLDNEKSLGYVDCRQETVDEYQKIFDYLWKKLAIEIKKEDDLNGF